MARPFGACNDNYQTLYELLLMDIIKRKLIGCEALWEYQIVFALCSEQTNSVVIELQYGRVSNESDASWEGKEYI